MKHLLVFFMLVLVPLQYAWAGVSVYCQHENGKAAQHFGHHPDEHPANAQIDDTHKDDPGLKTFDHDHHHFLNPAILAPDMTVPNFIVQSAVVLTAESGFTSSIAGPPERPKWVFAA